MITLSVDLAPRHSGIVVLDNEEIILSRVVDVGPESDGFETHAVRMVDALADVKSWLVEQEIHVDLVIVEDVAVQMVKPANALRLQGLVRWYLFTELHCDTLTIMPSVWQKWWGWKKVLGKTSKGFSSYVAKALGYTFTGTRGKALTDLNDAALIARWGYETQKDNYEH